MPSRKCLTSKPSDASADQAQAERALDSFIAKFEPVNAELIRDCRTELKALLPTAIEIVYDNYNLFVIGYCSSERSSDCIVSIAAAANGVGLSFYYGAALPDPTGILEGSGKQNRFIRLPTAGRLKDSEVVNLIYAAAEHGKTKLPAGGASRLVIKSVSAKQSKGHGSVPRVRPNPSLKRSANGRPPGPRGASVYHAPHGPGVLPLSPA
jgi:hypothetical protein